MSSSLLSALPENVDELNDTGLQELATHLAMYPAFADDFRAAEKLPEKTRPLVLRKTVTACIGELLKLQKMEKEEEAKRTALPEIILEYRPPTPRTSTTFSMEALDVQTSRTLEALNEEQLRIIAARTGETIEEARQRITKSVRDSYASEQ